MDLDAITIITYVCAGLGGVLLFLCIILACFFLYIQIKKYCFEEDGENRFRSFSNRGNYRIVPAENGQLLETGNQLNKKGKMEYFIL